MATPHLDNLSSNRKQVRRLLEIHGIVAGKGVGYKHDVEVLHKSAVVLLVASWEAYVEDLATNAFEALLAAAKDHTVFPPDVLTSASSALKKAADNREIWKLAGNGWKQVLKDHKLELFGQYIGKLNTPKPKQIDGLFHALIGISNISSRWHWKGMSEQDSADKLEGLIELRGSIAHRVTSSKKVYKYVVEDYVDFVTRLAVISSNRVLAFVTARTGTAPWSRYRFKRTT